MLLLWLLFLVLIFIIFFVHTSFLTDYSVYTYYSFSDTLGCMFKLVFFSLVRFNERKRKIHWLLMRYEKKCIFESPHNTRCVLLFLTQYSRWIVYVKKATTKITKRTHKEYERERLIVEWIHNKLTYTINDFSVRDYTQFKPTLDTTFQAIQIRQATQT